MLARSNFSSQQPKKKERALLLHHRFKVFPIAQPVFPICGIVWLMCVKLQIRGESFSSGRKPYRIDRLLQKRKILVSV